MNKQGCFKIQLLATDSSQIFDLSQATPIYQRLNDRSGLLISPTIIEADPFLFVKGDTLYLFYESKRLRSPGVIKMVSTKDLEHWTKPVVVLKEPFHLSFPFVFEDNGKIYMIPETGQDNSVRLYEAVTPSLTRFRFVQHLLQQPQTPDITTNYADSSVFKKRGKYYLLTTVQYAGVNTLELYTADSLTGPYGKHPASPICKSRKYGRCGGSIIEHDGKIFRISQDCEHSYGENISVNEIQELSPTAYSEQTVHEDILPRTTGFYKDGGHQLNKAEFLGKTILATDAKEFNLFFIAKAISIAKRILNGK